MKSNSKQSFVIVIIVLIMIGLSYGFVSTRNEKIALEQNMALLEDSLKGKQNEASFYQLKNEVLSEINQNLSSQLHARTYKHVEHKRESFSNEQKAVHALIGDLENGWMKMMETKDPDAVLDFFLPKYTTNSVKIDTRNMPFVQRHNDTDFRKQLNHLVASKDLTLSFDEPRFYSTIIRGNLFTTSYLSHLTARHQDKIVHKSTILCFVSGEKKNGRWLIGNYNWTRYDDYDLSRNHKELEL